MTGPSRAPIRTSDPVNRNHGLNQGLVAWWKTVPWLSGSNKWFDLMGLYHGALLGVSTTSGWQPTTRPDGMGAVAFDGTAYVALSAIPPSLQLTGPMSVFAWMKIPSTLQDNTYYHLANFYQGGTLPFIGWGWAIHGGASGSGYSRAWSDGYNDWVEDSTVNLADSAWHHAGWTSDGTQLQFYVDGRPTYSLTGYSPPSVYSGPAYLGGFNGAGSFLGSLDDITLHNRVLSPSEILGRYRLSSTGYGGLFNHVERSAVPAPRRSSRGVTVYPNTSLAIVGQ